MKNYMHVFVGLVVTLTFLNACQNPNEIVTNHQSSSRSSRQSESDGVASRQSDQLKDLTINGDYEVRNGILHFKDVRSYYSVKEQLQKLPPEQRVEFTRRAGFVSLLDISQKGTAQFEQVKTPVEFDQLLLAYKDLYLFEDYVVKPNFNLQHASLLNR